ncbi:PAS domain S-box protein [Nitratidesulfovibrio sp. 1201_IL3209]|uniref:PAS domain S-box protein n=1 Tax=Nitratidesulfovibrio sp. 1201_IL3209 TaxID=3084053 RepID=UPI002FD9AF39
MTQPLRVLIAEDDPVGAALLKGLLVREGHVVLGPAAMGEDAVRLARDERPDAVLMDIWLAGRMNGVEATRAVTADFDIPVILVTGATEATDRDLMDQVAGSGALGFMSKPVTGDALRMNLRIVRRHTRLLARLRDSEQRYRSIFDNAVVGIYMADPEGRYLVSNRAFAAMLGWSGPGELVSGVRSMDEQVYEAPGRRQELLARLRAEGTVTGFVSQVYGRDGDLLWVSEHCTAVHDWAGELLHYEGIVVNVTARIEAEQRWRTTLGILRNTIDAMPDHVVLLDLDRNVIMANASWVRHVCGPGEAGAASGATDLPGTADAAPGAVVVRCPDCVAEDGGPTPLDRFLREGGHQSGPVRLLPGGEACTCSVSPYRAPDGTVIGAVLVLHRDGEGGFAGSGRLAARAGMADRQGA